MAKRFLALIPFLNVDAAPVVERVLTSTNLNVAYATSSLVVFCDDVSGVTHLGKAGVIAGNLFRRDPRSASIATFSQTEAAEIITTAGRSLIEKFWGGYVAIFDDQRQHRVAVIRDPSGMMPCYYVETAFGVALASEVDDLYDSGLFTVEIDWQYIAHHLQAPDLPSERTGLMGVKELLAGFRLTVSSNEIQVDACWAPWAFASKGGHELLSDRVEQLHDTVSDCVQAWAGAFDHVQIGVSGGLDSSVVAACLAGSNTAVTCVTLATEEAEGDERRYARALTDSLGLPLVEALHSLDDVDVTAPTFSHLPRPGGPAFGQSGIKTKLRLAREGQVGAFFTGIGGDSVFGFTQSATPLLDRILHDGIGRGAWQTLNDICRLTDSSYWEVIGSVIRKARNGPAPASGPIWPWLAPLSDPMDLEPHPWLIPPSGVLPGKVVHVAAIARMYGCMDSFSRRGFAPQIHPLLSQPIVELCLQIPSWEWITDGQNRSIARHAFNRYFPDVIRYRRTKGGPTHFACRVVESNLPALNALLMNGLLRQNNLFDPTYLEPRLAGAEKIIAPDHVRISILAETEVWARYWSCRGASCGMGSGPAPLTRDRATASSAF
jgi:asparagine synthase (glutamine-hydrolysing)